ncbi:23S rRNA (adenine(2503)-C(2))-methyltransferase RlmN [Candidatus Stoquefichus massiliensis]|uniref:23S rRNA (adenine(2503)-C(2))-methyltransferase RlmN n=1 Tax=Candidatus Stoquefichus massiliensis TaxID=1470350 RepID=UPI00047F2230|nr:23S rRNA (adenine(2503)-C(2))-methyltransferase RlmN [Candidatus Stoquefichus massiliensis]
MKSIYDYTQEQLINEFLLLDEKKFRATQVFEWLYRKNIQNFNEMSNLSLDLRQKLISHFEIGPLKIIEKQISKDGTIKYLLALSDGGLIETVLMIHEYGRSLCVTSQLGCNMGCLFCASGLLKKQRDLSAGEMVNQVLTVMNDTGERISHVVVMGTGEPFDNYDQVMNFIHIINHAKGLAIGARHLTISTCGLCDKIEKYANEGIQTNLAISLHAPNDEIRDQLMPINKRFPMDDLRKSLQYYIEKTNRRITFEYILLKGVNDHIIHARQLAHYMRGLNAYVNLIPYNAVDEHGYQQTDYKDVEIFKDELLRLKINVTLRKEHGRDIDGACGQLRAKKVGESVRGNHSNE